MDETLIDELTINKSIIVNIRGGLGNQLFQIAVGYALSKELKLRLYVSELLNFKKSNNKHNKFNNNYINTIFEYFLTNNIKYFQLKNYNILRNNKYKILNNKNFNRIIKNKETIILNNNGFIIQREITQNYSLFSKYADDIRNLVIKGLQNNIDLMKTTYNTKNTAFIHIRRGDYLLIPSLFIIPEIDYYIKCIELLKEKKKIRKIFIFTNDLKYVKKQEVFNNELFQIINEPNELNTISLMSLCKSGAIITNSTFGWWGAFLGSYKNNNPVFYLREWIKGKLKSGKIRCPKEWIPV
jgi:hypothetical protein